MHMPMKLLAPLGAVALFIGVASDPAAALTDAEVADHSHALLFGQGSARADALDALAERGLPDAAAVMITALRFRPYEKAMFNAALAAVTGGNGDGWFEWMLWQEANPEIEPHKSFPSLKLELLQRIDFRLGEFIAPYVAKPGKWGVRLEEIAWGGVSVDGIPPLDDPPRISAPEVRYLRGDDLVFGVEINGDARAYPLRIMGWHEMVNETIGGEPVTLAYCTLCGSGILYETQIDGMDKPLSFSTSGLLYRSNKLMYDRNTKSLWNQMSGRPVSGLLYGQGIELTVHPVVITSWAAWRHDHPDTTVLAINTGYSRDYGSGVVYRDYFASPDLMFPARMNNERLLQKDYVFGIRAFGAARAWPLAAFEETPVINDAMAAIDGVKPLVLIGDAETRTVRAYERGRRVFSHGEDRTYLQDENGERWQLTEAALRPATGEGLPRVPGHVAYWFAWSGYWQAQTTLYPEPFRQ